jgi:hypothetical protein
MLNEHIAAGRMRASSSPYSLPAFVIPKHQDRFPLPQVDDILADCGRGKIFGKLDMTNSFFQTRVHPEDVPYTAVRTPWGLYEWLVMPQESCNAPSTHQCHVTDALCHLIGKICHIYVDDIVIWSNTIEEHRRNVQLVLDALRAAQLHCNPDKSICLLQKSTSLVTSSLDVGLYQILARLNILSTGQFQLQLLRFEVSLDLFAILPPFFLILLNILLI